MLDEVSVAPRLTRFLGRENRGQDFKQETAHESLRRGLDVDERIDLSIGLASSEKVGESRTGASNELAKDPTQLRVYGPLGQNRHDECATLPHQGKKLASEVPQHAVNRACCRPIEDGGARLERRVRSEDRREEVRLIGEVVIEQPFVHAHCPGDVANRCCPVAPLREHLQGRLQQLLAASGCPRVLLPSLFIHSLFTSLVSSLKNTPANAIKRDERVLLWYAGCSTPAAGSIRSALIARYLMDRGDQPGAPTVRHPQSLARSQMANERTFLAWLRTGLSMITVGLAAAQFLPRGFVLGIPAVSVMAVLLVAGGVFLAVVGWRHYETSVAALEGREFFPSHRPVAVAAGVVVIVGLIAIALVVFLHE